MHLLLPLLGLKRRGNSCWRKLLVSNDDGAVDKLLIKERVSEEAPKSQAPLNPEKLQRFLQA